GVLATGSIPFSRRFGIPFAKLLDGEFVNQPAEDLARKKVLVVDDAEPIRRLVCSTLAQYGFACLEAADGVEALEVINRLRLDLDLILTDLVMPRMDGKELAGRLSALQPELRVM